MEIEEIRTEWGHRAERFRALEEEARFILGTELKRRGIKIHSMPSRVKDIDSFLNKAKRMESVKPFDDIHDVVGLRVICLFLSDIPRVGEAVRESFGVLSEDDKIEGAEISSFGYMSFHFVVEMKSEYKGPRYDSIARMPFEIQVRTILMDAWANVSHYLSYKSDTDVPRNLKRDFYALSGLFYIADSHFELFFKSSKESREQMVALARGDHSEFIQQEINLDSLAAYLRNRLPQREHGSVDALSGLIQELSGAGLRTIGDIDALLQKAATAVDAVERDPDPALITPFTDVGALRLALYLAHLELAAEKLEKVFPPALEVIKKYASLVKDQ